MTDFKNNMEELETRIDTPYKTFAGSFSNKKYREEIRQNPEIQASQHQSDTQNNLYSRSIVRKLLLTSQNKSIKHEINAIPKDSPLYAKPNRYNASQFHFDTIPPTNPHYSSSCSNKIKTINDGLRENKTMTKNTYRHKSQNKTTQATMSQGKDRVSLSGLITYKFNSINAKRSLGLNQIDHEQQMREDIKKSTNICHNNRFKKILFKNHHKKYKTKIKQDQNILSNFENTTTQYLKDRMKQNNEEKLIYGEKFKKLHFIKDYMYSEKTGYEEGRFVIDEIEKHQPKEEGFKHRKCRTQIDQEVELEQRIMPVKRNPVNIRFLTFID